MTSTTHRAALRRAVRAGLAFGPVLQDRSLLLRVALGICLATGFGLALGDQLAETLLCVGAFFGGLGTLIPHERHRIVVAWSSAAMSAIAASAGAVLQVVWPVVYVVLFVGMFAAGLLRAVSVGLGVRILFASIVMLIVAESVPEVASAETAVGWLSLGAVISAAYQFLPPYGPRYGPQRLACLRPLRRFGADRTGEGGRHRPAAIARRRDPCRVARRLAGARQPRGAHRGPGGPAGRRRTDRGRTPCSPGRDARHAGGRRPAPGRRRGDPHGCPAA